MSILCTFPGRYGDLIWALPTLRALARRTREAIDLQIAGEFASIVPLLQQQLYLGHVTADHHWSMAETQLPPDLLLHAEVGYTDVYHLGYRGWPQRPLPFETLDRLNEQARTIVGELYDENLHLEDPWIHIDGPGAPCDVAVGFTEAWFELKLGLMICLDRRLPGGTCLQLTPSGSRWTREVPPGCLAVLATSSWLEIARAIRNADLFFGDCSALHVLAVALGKPAVVCEPMEARWNPIFYPLGMDGPQVTVVKGNDGKPTFDARHCADAIEVMLKETT